MTHYTIIIHGPRGRAWRDIFGVRRLRVVAHRSAWFRGYIVDENFLPCSRRALAMRLALHMGRPLYEVMNAIKVTGGVAIAAGADVELVAERTDERMRAA